jgi:type II secretion system protein G
MKIYRRTVSGFTIIELLVVIAIIGLLASVVLVSVNSARAKSRDAARVQAMKQVQSALELYYADNKHYPLGNEQKIPDLVAGDLNPYLKALPKNWHVPNTKYGDEEISEYLNYNSDGAYYNIYTPTETGGAFHKNIGCDETDYAQHDGYYDGTAYCLASVNK